MASKVRPECWKEEVMNKNILYRSLSFIWRKTILKWYRNYKNNRVERYWAEHKVRRGKENKDKTFYVIRRRDLYCGLFSLVLTNLTRINEAVNKGYIPVIDMQNDFNIYLAEDKIGKENAWEYFFEQPAGYSLQDISKSKNVIIGSGAVPAMFPYLDVRFLLGETGELEYWRELTRRYIRVNSSILEMVEKKYAEYFDSNDKVLGVMLRGTDYTAGRPKNHPIQPTPTQALQKVREIYNEQKCTKVFLTTEDEIFYKVLKENFGNLLVTNKKNYHKYCGDAIGKEDYAENEDRFSAGQEYLISTLLLAKCNCLCAGCVSGSVGALLLTEGFEYTYLFDLGIYD